MAIANTLTALPQLLMMDEPVSSLDGSGVSIVNGLPEPEYSIGEGLSYVTLGHLDLKPGEQSGGPGAGKPQINVQVTGMLLSNGNQIELLPDGSTLVTDKNGHCTRTWPNGESTVYLKTGQIIHYDKQQRIRRIEFVDSLRTRNSGMEHLSAVFSNTEGGK